MSGFGSIVIALSLGALLLPIAAMLPVLVTLNVFTSSWLVWQHRRHVDHVLLWRRILPLMLAGTVPGVWLRDVLPGGALKTGFALLMLWFSLRELWSLHRAATRAATRAPHPAWLTQGLIVAAGVTHGLFASGGPLLVYALAGSSIGKARFRATLIAVWLLLNGVLCTIFLVQGKLAAQWPQIAGYLPVLALSVWLGNHLHHRLDEGRFRVMVFRLLGAVAAALLLSQALAG